MIPLLAAIFLAGGSAPGVSLSEAAHAIESNRLVQARRMLADAIAAGRQGPEVDRLLADLAFADGRWTEALTRYSQLLGVNPGDWRSAERAGIGSLMLGDAKRARTLIDSAIFSGKASWRAWNALGVLCDLQSDWDGADAAYATADELAPGHAEVLNNLGWSLILRGEWGSAVQVLEKAFQVDPNLSRIENNLELARSALAADLPSRLPGESDTDFAARLNDAGVAAEKIGDRGRAIAAFARALSVSDSWYARAANNLAKLQAR